MAIENKIRLNALNNDDLKIFSFLCQDAIIAKEEMFYDETQKMFCASNLQPFENQYVHCI